MKTFLCAIFATALACVSASAQTHIRDEVGGYQLGISETENIGFHGATPSPQRSGSAQAAVTLTYAGATLTFTGQPVALTPASGVLTIGVNPTANDVIVLASGTYVFKSSLSGSNQILISGSLAGTIANTVGAINAASTGGQASGTTYGAGTIANASVTAASGTGNTIVATAITSGTAGNALVSTGTFTSGSNSWGASTLTGGLAGETFTVGSTTYTFASSVGATANRVLKSGSTAGTIANLIAAVNGTPSGSGVLYGSATVANASATAATGTGTTVVFTAINSGTAGNAITSTDTIANASFGGSTFSGGADADVNKIGVLLNELRASMVQKGLIKGGQ